MCICNPQQWRLRHHPASWSIRRNDHRPSHRIPGRVTEEPHRRGRRYWCSQAIYRSQLSRFRTPLAAGPECISYRQINTTRPFAFAPTSARSHAPPADNAAWPRVQRWRLSQASKSPIHHDQAPVSARPVQSCGLVSQFSSCPSIAAAATAPSRRLNCQPTRDTALALLIPRSDETVHSAPGRVITSSAPRRGHREAGRHV